MKLNFCRGCARRMDDSHPDPGEYCPDCARDRSSALLRAKEQEQEAYDSRTCAKCNRLLVESPSVTVWDHRSFCESCIRDSGISGFHPEQQAIEETLRIGFWRGVGLGVYSGIIMPTILAGVLSGVLLLLYVSFLFGGVALNAVGPAAPLQLLKGFGFVFAIMWALFAIGGLPTSIFGTILALRRSIRVSEGVIIAEAGFRQTSFPLRDSYWTVAPTCIDGFTIFSLWRPSIVIRNETEVIVCGFNPATLRFWQAYLTLAVGSPISKHNWLQNCRLALFHFVFGAVAGWLLGTLANTVVAHRMWVSATTFLGMLDGLISAGFVLLRGHPKAKNFLHQTNALLFAIVFATLGAKVGISAGWPGLGVCSLFNGIIGWLLGREIRHRIQIDEPGTSPGAASTDAPAKVADFE